MEAVRSCLDPTRRPSSSWTWAWKILQHDGVEKSKTHDEIAILVSNQNVINEFIQNENQIRKKFGDHTMFHDNPF